VELDADIHGLAHVSELSEKPVEDLHTIAKEGDVVDFKVVSIEPKEHRLGLSIKALKEPTAAKEENKEEVPEPQVA
jgi:small subunit ribosomal protein S1